MKKRITRILLFVLLLVVCVHMPAKASEVTETNPLSKPELVEVKNTDKGVSVSWEPVEGAVKYRVYYKLSGQNWISNGDFTGTSCTVAASKLTSTNLYFFTVKAFDADGNCSAYDSGLGITWLEAPKLTSVSPICNDFSGRSVLFKWEPLSWAHSYVVYYKESGGNWKTVEYVHDTQFRLSDSYLTNGKTYTFTVQAVYYGNRSGYNSTGKSITWVNEPATYSFSCSSSGVSATWNSVPGAVKYAVYYLDVYGDCTWKKLGTYSSTSCTIPNTKLTYGRLYYFAAQAIDRYGNKGSRDTDSGGANFYYLKTPTVSVSNTSSGVKVSWNAIKGAQNYTIYRKTKTGSYSKIKTIDSGSSLSYTDTSVKTKNGSTYIYAVRANYGTTIGGRGSKTIVRLDGTTISSLSKVKSYSIKVRWASDVKATGYQVQYAINSSFSNAKRITITSNTRVSKTISSLTRGKTYYVRVRTYKTVGSKKYYSAWSEKKSIKR